MQNITKMKTGENMSRVMHNNLEKQLCRRLIHDPRHRKRNRPPERKKERENGAHVCTYSFAMRWLGFSLNRLRDVTAVGSLCKTVSRHFDLRLLRYVFGWL